MKDHQLKAWLQLAESGSIRAAARDLGISPAAVTKGVLPEVVQAFRKAMPAARLTLFDGLVPQAVPLLREGRVDFAVSAPTAPDLEADIAFEPLDSLEMAVLCRRGHPLRRASTWEEVVDAEWMMHIAPGSQHASWLERLKVDRKRAPEHVIEVNSFGTSWSLLTRSDALLVAPAHMLRLPPYGEMIERVPLNLDLPPLQLGLLTLRGIPLSMAADRLADQFRKFIALARR